MVSLKMLKIPHHFPCIDAETLAHIQLEMQHHRRTNDLFFYSDLPFCFSRTNTIRFFTICHSGWWALKIPCDIFQSLTMNLRLQVQKWKEIGWKNWIISYFFWRKSIWFAVFSVKFKDSIIQHSKIWKFWNQQTKSTNKTYVIQLKYHQQLRRKTLDRTVLAMNWFLEFRLVQTSNPNVVCTLSLNINKYATCNRETS